MSAGTFDVSAVVSAVPSQPAWTPKVECSYYLDGVSKGNKSFSGWQGSFNGLNVPQTVGTHTLLLKMVIRKPDGTNVRSQDVTMPLHVVFNTPVGVGKPPKKVWLEKACTWTSGATTEKQVLDKLNSGIYGSGGPYENCGSQQHPCATWSEYVEGNSQNKWANCVTYSSVWNSLCQVLGVTGTDTPQNRGSKNIGFLTIACTSSDGKKGNAYPLVAPGQWDKWDFSMHQVGRKTTFWDPTMNKTYTGINDFIKWNHVKSTDYGYEADGNHIVKWVSRYNGSWPGVSYNPATKLLFSSDQSVSGNGHFVGVFSDSAYDDDSDGLFDRLVAKARVHITEEGRFLVGAHVLKGDTVVSLRPSWNSSQPSRLDTQLTTGEYDLEIPFSGEEIYNSGADGPYTIRWSLADSNIVPLDSAEHLTWAFSHTAFGEKPARIQSQWDGGQDTNGNGKFDILCSHVTVYLSKEGKYVIGGILTVNDSVEIASASSDTQSVGPGTVVFDLNFNGPTIKEKGIPWAIRSVSLDNRIRGWSSRRSRFHYECLRPSRF